MYAPAGLKLSKKMEALLIGLMILNIPFKLFRKLLKAMGLGNGRVI